jgi:hypothetical protein
MEQAAGFDLDQGVGDVDASHAGLDSVEAKLAGNPCGGVTAQPQQVSHSWLTTEGIWVS